MIRFPTYVAVFVAAFVGVMMGQFSSTPSSSFLFIEAASRSIRGVVSDGNDAATNNSVDTYYEFGHDAVGGGETENNKRKQKRLSYNTERTLNTKVSGKNGKSDKRGSNSNKSKGSGSGSGKSGGSPKGGGSNKGGSSKGSKAGGKSSKGGSNKGSSSKGEKKNKKTKRSNKKGSDKMTKADYRL